MTQSAAPSLIFEAFLAGRYQEATEILATAGADDAFRREIAAHIEFHTGRLRPVTPTRWFEALLWRALLGPMASVIALALRVFAIVIQICGLRRSLSQNLASRWVGDIIHYRYTNFARGLWQCLCLYRLLSTDEALLRAYLLGIFGHFLGMSGRYDRSIRVLTSARIHLQTAVKRAPSDQRAYQYYCEILAIEALHKGYAGYHTDAKKSFDQLFQELQQKPYWWINIFARSMRLHVAMETVDGSLLREDALHLKRMLGTAFESKYALRTTGYSALVAAIKGNRGLALSQLLESERFYDGTKVPIERSRYHFIRALAELELGEQELAMNDARIAVANLSFVPGARFHAAEAELLDIEVRLRLALTPGLKEDFVDLAMVSTRLDGASSLVRGAPAITEKIAGLRLLLLLAQGRALEASATLPALSAKLGVHAGRLALVVLRATGSGTGEALHRSPQLESLKEEFGLTDLMIKVLAPERKDQDIELLIRTVFGASTCKMTMRDRSGAVSAVAVGQFEVAEDDAHKIVLKLPVGRREIEFIALEPLRSLQFDERVRRNLELAAAIIQSIHLNEALAASEKSAGVGMATQMLAHDVRKPFSLLRMTIAQMRAASTPAAHRDVLQRGEEAVGRALAQAETMIADVMDFGARGAARLQDISLTRTIQEVLEEIHELGAPGAPSVECHFAHRACAKIDKPRVLRVLHNLIQNAVQATGTNGRIWIKTAERASDLEITIGNDGPPIAAEHLNRIFDAYFTKGKAGGTGLGLTIAKQIVEDHGGDIRCTSDPILGTEFRITLPKGAVALDVQSRATPSVPDAVPLSGKVVVLDDDPFVLESWMQTLDDCDVLAYADPAPFLQAIAVGRIRAGDLACIITDYHFTDDILDKDLDRLAALDVPLLLSSDAMAPRQSSRFHGIIEKVALDSRTLAGLIGS